MIPGCHGPRRIIPIKGLPLYSPGPLFFDIGLPRSPSRPPAHLPNIHLACSRWNTYSRCCRNSNIPQIRPGFHPAKATLRKDESRRHVHSTISRSVVPMLRHKIRCKMPPSKILPLWITVFHSLWIRLLNPIF